MDFAFCTVENKNYTAYEYSKLTTNEIISRKGDLFCSECKAKAYYKKRARSGQASCFGARPHLKNCSQSTMNHSNSSKVDEYTKKEFINSGKNIVIRFNEGENESQNAHNISIGTLKNRLVGKGHHCRNGTDKSKSIRKLSSILKLLYSDTEFERSDQTIDIGHQYPYKVSKLFRSVLKLNEDDLYRFKGIYGQLSSISEVKTGVWINTNAPNKFSIYIEQDIYREILARSNRNMVFEENIFLCLGKIQKSQNGKWYMKLNSADYFVIR
jgi:hypothetical protein